MYRLNELKRPVLITVDEVVAKAAMMGNPDVRMILQNIEIAEERIVAPAIGDAMYEDFLGKKNVLVTASNQADLLIKVNVSRAAEGKTSLSTASLPVGALLNAIELVQDVAYRNLWNRFLWRVTAEAVDMMCTVPSWLQHTAQGQIMNKPAIIGSSGESASGSAKDIKFKMDVQMQERINPLIARMKEWMRVYRTSNPSAFPLYAFPREEKDEGINYRQKGGFVFGAYDDDDEDYCTGTATVATPAPVVNQQPTMRRMQFITEPGQTVYPLPGQLDEAEVREELKGSSLISFSIEGVELYQGDEPGEMVGLDPTLGQIEWNDASANPLRCILKYEKI